MKRIYSVTSSNGNIRLIRALNASRALKVVASDYVVKLASQDDLVKTLGTGIMVEEEATVPTPQEPLGADEHLVIAEPQPEPSSDE